MSYLYIIKWKKILTLFLLTNIFLWSEVNIINQNLSDEEKSVLISKATQRPFVGKYNNFFEKGIYHCKNCDAPLYKSDAKFESTCGWPSFDDEIIGAIKRVKDHDGHRTEIICANCNAHLGHVFVGERLTTKNIRHCVNSISMVFKANTKPSIATAYFGGGCFWGVEHLLEKQKGVIDVVSGYMGGKRDKPSYKEVSHNNQGEIEVVEVQYNPTLISFETLTKLFFEIHDPTQKDRQGVDRGYQYNSVVFYNSEKEKKTSQMLIDILKNKGYKVVTKLLSKKKFTKAEDYHQDYYKRTKKEPYCHVYIKKF